MRSNLDTIKSIGIKGENLFSLFVPRATKTLSKKSGDFDVPYKKGLRSTEMKECGKNTINQVRAIRYIPLVVHFTREDYWAVIPPNELVKMASKRNAGQHGILAYENMTITTNNIEDKWKCSGDQLHKNIIKAIKEGEKNNHMRDGMRVLQAELEGIKDRYNKKYS